MLLHQHLFGCTRTQALQRGQVLDISPVACQAFVEVPLAITPKLWRAIAPDDRFRREALAAAAEVQARGAYTIGISPDEENEFDVVLPVSGEPGSMFEAATIAQLMAYELALLRGCDPDRPRNLAKSVTVK